jgi:hypothetical protein
MGEIRPFLPEHVPAVADLHLKVMRGRPGRAGKTLENYFHEMFFSNPWISEEFPSLVYMDKGELVGFLGILPRTMDFNGKPIRVAVGAQYMVDRERHRGLAGLELRRRFFQGPQDLSFEDGAGEANHIVWTAAGGLPAQLYAFNWLRVLRPLGTARSFVDRAQGAARWAGKICLVGAGPIDFLLSKVPHSPFGPPQAAYVSRQVSVDALFERIQAIGWREPLKPAYDLQSFRWLMSQIALGDSREQVRMACVEASDGDPCGWYAYTLQPDGAASLLQIGVRRRDQFDAVLLALFQDAWQQGAVFVKGQAIPQFLVNLTNQQCLFRQTNTSVLIHSRDRELLDTILRGKAALSRLDGESWMRFGSVDSAR